MGLTLAYLNDNHGVMATAFGELTGAELIDAVRRTNDFAVTAKGLCYTFFDFGSVKTISISIGDVARAADCAIEAAKLSDTERIVSIFANGEFSYRLALLYMTFIEETGWEVWVFRDRSEAVSWLRGRVALKHGIIADVG
jgi:hypothetical protein